jgi:replicative DNA helicase
MARERTVPFSNEAEMYVLGSIFIDSAIMADVAIKLYETDFHDPRHKNIYSAIYSLYKGQKNITYVTVLEELKKLNLLEASGSRAYLTELLDVAPSTANIGLYLDIIKEKAVERELLSTLKEISDKILTGELDYNDLIDKTEDSVLAVTKRRKTSDFLTIDKAAQQIYEKIEENIKQGKSITGLDLNYNRLNGATLGFQKGDLIILAARPSVGKSTFALNLALNVCNKNNAHVAFFSLEMSVEQILMRLFSYISSIPLTQIRNGRLTVSELASLSISKQILSRYNLYLDESNSTDINEIKAKSRKLKQDGKLDFIIVDYMQLISNRATRGNRQEEVSQISRELKILAKELEVPVLALSQLSRNIEQRDDKRPILADLRESGSIEQDADMVLFLYREEEKKTKKGSKNEEIDEQVRKELEEANQKIDDERTKLEQINLFIAKNRQGVTSVIEYTFMKNECKFYELQRDKFVRGVKDNPLDKQN